MVGRRLAAGEQLYELGIVGVGAGGTKVLERPAGWIGQLVREGGQLARRAAREPRDAPAQGLRDPGQRARDQAPTERSDSEVSVK